VFTVGQGRVALLLAARGRGVTRRWRLIVLVCAAMAAACDDGQEARAEADFYRDRVAELEDQLERTRAALREANDAIVTAQDQITAVRLSDGCDELQDATMQLEDVDEVDEPR
jgi:hypothetical protein